MNCSKTKYLYIYCSCVFNEKEFAIDDELWFNYENKSIIISCSI